MCVKFSRDSTGTGTRQFLKPLSSSTILCYLFHVGLSAWKVGKEWKSFQKAPLSFSDVNEIHEMKEN